MTSKSERLRKYRVNSSLTQEVASKICHSSKNTWESWESGKKDVPESIIHLLCLLTGQKYDGDKGYDDEIPDLKKFYDDSRSRGNEVAGDRELTPEDSKNYDEMVKKIQEGWKTDSGKGRPPPEWMFGSLTKHIVKNDIMTTSDAVAITGIDRDSLTKTLKKKFGEPTGYTKGVPGSRPEAYWDSIIVARMIIAAIENEIKCGRFDEKKASDLIMQLRIRCGI